RQWAVCDRTSASATSRQWAVCDRTSTSAASRQRAVCDRTSTSAASRQRAVCLERKGANFWLLEVGLLRTKESIRDPTLLVFCFYRYRSPDFPGIQSYRKTILHPPPVSLRV